MHVHVDDTSDEATFDFQIVLHQNFDLREINFGVDAFGRKQRYKVIVFNLKMIFSRSMIQYSLPLGKIS